MAVNKKQLISGAIAMLLLISSPRSASAQSPHLKLEEGKVRVENLDAEFFYTFSRFFNTQADWESVFPITTKSNINDIVIAGSYEVSADAVTFTPRFPFVANVDYVAIFHTEELTRNKNDIYLPKLTAESVRIDFRLSPANDMPAEITAIYPSSDILPANLLKIHLTFSKSMTSGEVYSKLKLLDQENNVVEKPFLMVDQELWDGQMKTITVLFDPGRIKRGLRPNIEMKPALKENQTYTLIIEEGWKDIDGLATTKPFKKHFRCIAADRTSPSVKSYIVHAPLHATAPLVVSLNEPHDYVLLSRYMRVSDASGANVEGFLRVKCNESCVEFVPKNPWVESKYTIEVNPLLEDLAGNNLNRLFDEDMTRSSTKNETGNRLHFSFSAPER